MNTQGWPPKDWRALIALAASIVGSAVLTGFAAWLVWILWRGGWAGNTAEQRLTSLGTALLITLGIMGLVLISLGLAINRRSLKLSRDGFEASGGDDPAPAPAPIAVAIATAEPVPPQP